MFSKELFAQRITELRKLHHETQEDLGAVIGRAGKIANAIRTLVQAAAYTTDQGRVRINIDAKK